MNGVDVYKMKSLKLKTNGLTIHYVEKWTQLCYDFALYFEEITQRNLWLLNGRFNLKRSMINSFWL